MNFATLNGINVHYRSDGDLQGTPLVLIHSLGTDLRLWDDLVPRLDPTLQLVRFDLRGHGLSADPAGELTLVNFSADLAALLDHLEIDKAVMLGISIGGLIALDFALRNQARVSCLILADTAARIGTPELWQSRIDTIRAHGMAHLADSILARWFVPDFAARFPIQFQGLCTLFIRNSAAGYTAACAALRDADLRAEVSQITVPTLVLCGAHDAATPPDIVQELAQSLPHAGFAVLPDAGHTPPIEQPQIMADQINAFLRAHQTVGSVYEQGMKIRRDVLGDAHVDHAEANKTSFDTDFQRFITETAWGMVWARQELDRRTRHLLTLAMLAALGKEHEFAMHVRASRNTGVTMDEIKEMLLQVAVYAGVPAANSAIAVAKQVFAEFED
ncbi:MAG TPA: 3-oxoadipate enol-lactonase [Anaerolineales bacterium]|nr:3-oxoadipate enol-lactonase [Anaerolineales bacterium]